MHRWPSLVVGVLLYVVLDAGTLGSLPGAFVFDPDDSVESLQASSVGRAVLRLIASVPQDTFTNQVTPPFDQEDRIGLAAVIAPRDHRPLTRRSRIQLHPPPSSEDPL